MGKEQRRTETKPFCPEDTCLVLDRGDMAALALRNIHTGLFGRGDTPTRGAMSFPRRVYNGDESLQSLVRALQANGKADVDIQTAKCMSPNEAGNVVVRLLEGENVTAALNQVDMHYLDPVLKIYNEGAVPVEKVKILPNVSNRKPKGIVVEVDPRKDKWWRSLPQFGEWPIGRGLGVTSLNINTDEFLNRGDEILAGTMELASRYDPGVIRYIQYLYDNSGQVFMSISGGPSYAESNDLVRQLAETSKPSAAKRIVDETQERATSAREALMAEITGALGLQEGERLFNVRYVGMDLDNGVLYSGAAQDSSNGLMPFTVGTAGLIVHTHKPDSHMAIGTKTVADPNQLFTPPGLQQPPFSNVPSSLFGKGTVEECLQKLPKTIDLRAFALGFHGRWGKKGIK